MGKRIVICGVDTNRLPKLSAKESRECLEAVKRGDKSAREHFINCNLRLVLSVVQKPDQSILKAKNEKTA